jgi:hypothetical protein
MFLPLSPKHTWLWIILGVFIVPLFVSILGGLIVEWLKSRDFSKPGTGGGIATSGESNLVGSGPAAPPIKAFANGPRGFLCDLEGFDVRSGEWPVSPNGQLGNGKDLIKVGGMLSLHGIGMHPPAAPGQASIKYRLDKQAALFKTTVAVDDSANFCWTPAIFTVLGDGLPLWQSQNIAHNHARTQECRIDVAGVQELELRVHCLGFNKGVYAVWVEPRILRNANTPDEAPAKTGGENTLPPGSSGSPSASAGGSVKLFTDKPRRFLTDLKGFDIQSGPWPVSPNGQTGEAANFIKVAGQLSPHGIGMHPPAAPGQTSIKYRLDKQAAVFKAVAALDDSSNFSFTPAVFTVLGDGKTLWQSQKISHSDGRTQECRVDVTGVQVLELRIQCGISNHGVHAVWVEPRVLQNADSPDAK